MSENTKKTSAEVAHLASETLKNPKASQISKSLAASVVAQSNSTKQTGAELEKKASAALRNKHSSQTTKTLAASVIAQANKERSSKK